MTVADDPNEMCPNALWMCYARPPAGTAPRERERERERLSERYRKKMPFLGQAAKRQVPLLLLLLLLPEVVVALMATKVWELDEVA